VSEGADTRIEIPAGLIEGVVRAEAASRTLGDVLPVALYVEANDPEGTVVFTSPQIDRILGEPEEVEGDETEPRTVDLRRSRIHPEDRERVARERRRSREVSKPFTSEYRLVGADGRDVWVRDHAVPVSDASGRPLYWRGVVADVTERRQAMDRLRASETLRWETLEGRRALLARVEGAQDEERRRIAADLHDDSIQVISAADLQLQALLTIVEDEDLRHGLREVHEILKSGVDGLRNLLVELRPPSLSEEGLEVALRTYLEELRYPVAWTLQVDLSEEPPADLGAIVFRIAQEAVTNAGKHADASRLDVRLADADGGIVLRVSDDGRGFDARGTDRSVPGHIGLPSMVERAELAGGWCRITSTPGHGTVVEAWMPVRPTDADASGPPG
jgi:PAS domain S-box-containing protein